MQTTPTATCCPAGTRPPRQVRMLSATARLPAANASRRGATGPLAGQRRRPLPARAPSAEAVHARPRSDLRARLRATI
ncbi:hypothetical protein FHR47_003982 [Xanthomonas arboricola]|nr:hypothetical protein [Xanthomonas cannabis]MBB3805773.1 hypothetical protein [Xanthomonas cannabis]